MYEMSLKIVRYGLQSLEKLDTSKSDGKKSGKNKFSEWAPLVGEMFPHLVGVFWCYLEAPSSHIRFFFLQNFWTY